MNNKNLCLYVVVSSGHLKQIFWHEVLPNIDQYELLDEDMKEYFNRDNLFLDLNNSNFAGSLNNNEPKGNGKDFMVHDFSPEVPPLSPETEGLDDETLQAQKSETIQNAFKNPTTYKSNFGWETDSDPEENCIKIKKTSQEATSEANELEEMARTFNAVLRTESDENELTLLEIKQLLSDADRISNSEQLNRLPPMLQRYLSDFKQFQKHLHQAEEAEFMDNNKENENTSSSIEVPSAGDSVLAEKASSNSGLSDASNRLLRSHSTSTLGSKPQHHSTPASQKPRSKKAVDEPSLNPRMEKFINAFNLPYKRRRNSSSSDSN